MYTRNQSSRLILFPLAAALSSCGIGGSWQPKAEAISPDGHLRAVLEYKGSAACCSDHSRLVLSNGNAGTLLDPGVVVTASNTDPRRPIWISNDLLLVEMCEATELNVRSRIWRDQMFHPDGRSDAVRVEVITAPNTRWDDRLLCPEVADG